MNVIMVHAALSANHCYASLVRYGLCPIGHVLPAVCRMHGGKPLH